MDFTIPYRDILDFWFGDSGGLEGETDDARGWPPESLRRRWFKSSDAQDAEIAERFGDRVAAALRRDLVDWEREPGPRLALILLLDQLPRMIHRGTPQAFAGDAQAQALVRQGLELGLEQQLPAIRQVFVYLVLEHAEELAAQNHAVERFQQLLQQCAPSEQKLFADYLDYAERHRQVIQRFGRFPHRNEVLGRSSSADELAFLQQPGSRF